MTHSSEDLYPLRALMKLGDSAHSKGLFCSVHSSTSLGLYNLELRGALSNDAWG